MLSVTADGTTTTQTMNISYNDGGGITSLVYPDGETITSQYDVNGRFQNAYFGTPSTPDPVTFLVGQTGYTGSGQLSSLAIGGSGPKSGTPTPIFTLSIGYDGIQRPQSSSATVGGSTIWSQARTYDNVGNVLQLATTVPTTSGGTLTDNQSFCYDAVSRLVWAGNTGTPSGGDHCGNAPTGTTLPSYQQAFSYDSLDRMVSGPAGSVTYGDIDHVHAATSLGSMPNPYAGYDAMGNMTCRNTDTTSGHTCGSSPTGALMSYDNEGRLASWTAPSGTTASDSFLYDNEGNRVLQRVNTGSVTDTITFDGYSETVLSGGTITITKYYNVNGQRVAMRTNSTLSYLLSDVLGSSTIALTSSGSTQAVQLFAPYGSIRYSQGTMPTTYNFTGQRLDSQTGLLYYGFRYYDPLSGRFTRADTTQTNAGGMDPYAYVGNNPETKNDPTGHDGWQTALIIGAIVAVVIVVVVVAVVAAPVIIAALAAGAEIAADSAVAAGTADAVATAAADTAATAAADTAATTAADTAATTAADTAATDTVATDTAADSSTTAAQDTASSDQGPVKLYRNARSPQGGNDPALNNLRAGKEYTPYSPEDPQYDPEDPQGNGTVSPNSDEGISAYTNRGTTWRHTYTINSDQAPEGYYWRQDPKDLTHYTLNPQNVTSKLDYISQVDTPWYRNLWSYLQRLR